MKTNDSTPVIFRLFGGEVIALFPAEASTVGNPYLLSPADLESRKKQLAR